MKIQWIVIALVCSMSLSLQAQVTINIVQPPAGMITKDQLWNLVLTNNSNTVSEVSILLNLKDAVTGQSVLSAGTRSLLLNKGIKMLAIQDIQPVQYNYGANDLAGKFLPLGAYIACYTVSRYEQEAMQTLATECARINIVPVSPPLLNTPANKSVLQTPAPQLTWIPPAPLDMFDNLNYSVSVAEVMEGQSPREAIAYNTPVYTTAHVKAPYENYPSSYSKLQPGKTYAWQVTARNGASYAATTEVWTFSLATDTTKIETVNASYILLDKENAGGVHTVKDKELKIKYYSFDKTHTTQVRFLDPDGKLVQEVKQAISYGDNYFGFKLNHAFRANRIYLIEITDLQENKHTASFSIQ